MLEVFQVRTRGSPVTRKGASPTNWRMLGGRAEGAGTGIGDREAASFRLYPNPASTHVMISDVVPGAEISVINLAGQQLQNFSAESTTVGVDVSGLGTGMYFIKVGDAAQKIIVE